MKILFQEGKKVNEECTNALSLINSLQKKREYLHSLNMDDLIQFFHQVSHHWKENKMLEQITGGSLKHLAQFIEQKQLVAMLDFALRGDYRILDRFVDLQQEKYIYHCQPRGLIVHWLSGNVPLLGLYSIIQAMLTKNVSLVKASEKAYEELVLLLDSMSAVNTENIQGSELLSTVAVVLVDRNDLQNQQLLSESADVRVVWGGQEAVETISSLRKSIFCEDIIYGPKYSYGVVDRESLQKMEEITTRLAFDVCTFDQYACSSPHTLFVEGSESEAEQFGQKLAEKMRFVAEKMLPKGNEEPKKRFDILAVRAKYSMLGKIFHSPNTDWTVVYTTEEGLAQACFSRVIVVKPINGIREVTKYNDRKKQTLGSAITSENREKIIDDITLHGIDRCPRFGDMTLYESPWDGFFAIDRMVRWVGLYKM